VNYSTKLLGVAVGFNSSSDRAIPESKLLHCCDDFSESRSCRSMNADDGPVESVTVLEEDLSKNHIDVVPQTVRARGTGDVIGLLDGHKYNEVEGVQCVSRGSYPLADRIRALRTVR
jgi:hypothetical protein